MRQVRRLFPVLALAAVLATPGPAEAALILGVAPSGGAPSFFNDCVAASALTCIALGGDLNPLEGQMAVAKAFGDFDFNLELVFSNSPGTADAARLTMVSINATSNSGGLMALSMSDNNFALPGASGSSMRLRTACGPLDGFPVGIGGTVSYFGSVDEGNVPFGAPEVQTSPIACMGAPAQATADWIRTTAQYALTGTAILALAPATAVGFAAVSEVTAVPEPGSLLLFGTGLLGLVRVARRRRPRA